MTANSRSDVDQSTAGASGASVGADQQTAGAQGTSTGYSDVGFKSQTDVNTEEALSTYNGFAVNRALHNMETVDNITTQILQNAVTQANTLVTQANETANMVAKQAVRHSDIAIDREWNLDEQVAAAAALYARLIERLNNPTPPAS